MGHAVERFCKRVAPQVTIPGCPVAHRTRPRGHQHRATHPARRPPLPARPPVGRTRRRAGREDWTRTTPAPWSPVAGGTRPPLTRRRPPPGTTCLKRVGATAAPRPHDDGGTGRRHPRRPKARLTVYPVHPVALTSRPSCPATASTPTPSHAPTSPGGWTTRASSGSTLPTTATAPPPRWPKQVESSLRQCAHERLVLEQKATAMPHPPQPQASASRGPRHRG